ncbi:hypothetical protein J6590_017983 [Homalodisca vitripennis]|nr:hypothetical protein J6590_017983 [Homalodisca vitripennis]
MKLAHHSTTPNDSVTRSSKPLVLRHFKNESYFFSCPSGGGGSDRQGCGQLGTVIPGPSAARAAVAVTKGVICEVQTSQEVYLLGPHKAVLVEKTDDGRWWGRKMVVSLPGQPVLVAVKFVVPTVLRRHFPFRCNTDRVVKVQCRVEVLLLSVGGPGRRGRCRDGGGGGPGHRPPRVQYRRQCSVSAGLCVRVSADVYVDDRRRRRFCSRSSPVPAHPAGTPSLMLAAPRQGCAVQVQDWKSGRLPILESETSTLVLHEDYASLTIGCDKLEIKTETPL